LEVKYYLNCLFAPIAIAPLVTFRVIFGAVMVFGVLRFWTLGWIEDHFITTQFTFKYFGFEWVALPSPIVLYILHVIMLLSALGITLGAFYRLSAVLFFLTFTYTELIDLSYYLNHYYFVSLVSFLLIFIPAHHHFSVDVWRKSLIKSLQTPSWTIWIFKFQLGVVYTYAGLAKINEDWLFHALPLKIWLPAQDALPWIGWVFRFDLTAYLFSWVGMLFDLTIVFWLMWHKSRLFAYLLVVIFHTLTGIFFQIGIFPLVMMGATWIFFSNDFHERFLKFLRKMWLIAKQKLPYWLTSSEQKAERHKPLNKPLINFKKQLTICFLTIYCVFQLFFPWRYLLYDGNLFWTEEGYRFSWRVMLMEKAGTAIFYVKDTQTGREGVVDNSEFLKPHQEKQMAMQPDMILQFAHFLQKHYAQKGVYAPQVRVEVYVTLNARPSQLLIDPQRDLTKIKDSWAQKDWVLPLNNDK
jgi:hypothetical protein